MILFQSEYAETVVDTMSGEVAVTDVTAPVAQLSLWDMCLQGGWLMIPLLLLSIVSIYILVERAIAIHRASVEDARSCNAFATIYIRENSTVPVIYADQPIHPMRDLSRRE